MATTMTIRMITTDDNSGDSSGGDGDDNDAGLQQWNMLPVLLHVADNFVCIRHPQLTPPSPSTDSIWAMIVIWR